LHSLPPTITRRSTAQSRLKSRKWCKSLTSA
jgi:hypothetical protein